MVYLRTAEGNDALAWIDEEGTTVTESQYRGTEGGGVFEPDTPAMPRSENHHELVRTGVEWIATEEKSVGGQLGRPSGARFRTYSEAPNSPCRTRERNSV